MDEALLVILRPRAAPAALAWLEKALASPTLAAFAAARRKVGSAAVELTAPEQRELGLDLRGWTLDDCARALLLRAATPRWAAECWRRAELRERRALLKALPLLRPPEAYLELALEGCRTAVTPVFEAVACDNRYPAMHFSDRAFACLALKAALSGLDLERIVGLEQRGGEELRRMARAAADERRAAGKPVPPELSALAGEAAEAAR